MNDCQLADISSITRNPHDFHHFPVDHEPRIGYSSITMTETWVQLMEQMLTRTQGVENRDRNYSVPGCWYGVLDLDEPEEIAKERLTQSTYHEIINQLEVAWGPPDFQGDGAGSGLRDWQDAYRLSYWKRQGDLAIVAIQAYDNTRLLMLTLSVRSAAEAARREQAFRESMARQMAQRKALSDERDQTLKELIAQLTDPAPDPRLVQVIRAGGPELRPEIDPCLIAPTMPTRRMLSFLRRIGRFL